MSRFLLLILLVVSAALGRTAAAAELPARPVPFRFVNDQGQLLSTAEAKSLENGLRRYADQNGTQIVVVTVPTLEGRDVADYARELGQSWGVGQKGKDNGVVILLGAQEHKVSIQAGSGLRDAITPAIVDRVINEQMTPSFKQGKYFAGLRAGLNTLLLAADPQAKSKNASAAAAPTTAAATGANDNLNTAAPDPYAASTPAAGAPDYSSSAAAEPAPSGPGFGTLAIGALLIGGVLWLVVRMFRRRSAPAAGGGPDFLPNQPNQPNQNNAPRGSYGRGPMPSQGPDFLGSRGGSGGSGIGGILATGAAAAAGAYLGNRMANGGHDDSNTSHLGADNANHNAPLNPGYGAGAGAGAAADGSFPALNNSDAQEQAPDYFADDSSADSGPDYFSSDDNSSYDDPSSGDSGGGGFDDDNSNSGSW